jgi:O-succinylbenzoate synthase
MIIQSYCFKPFLINSRIFRKGICLRLEGSNGRKTTVEVSPLPGFSKESFQDAKRQLLQIKREITATQWSKSTLQILGEMNLFSSVYFGLEMGILDLLDPVEGREKVKTYALLFGTTREIATDAALLEKQGIREIKVKLGHLSLKSAHDVIDPLIHSFSIRLDFNSNWNKDQTLRFCERYCQDQFLYIEEPCSSPEELSDFPYPFALDETLRTFNYQPLLKASMLKKLILKPTINYPITPFLQSGIPCVITSSFESKIGINQLRRMIRRFGLQKDLHGLDTLRHLNQHNEMSHCLTEKTAR